MESDISCYALSINFGPDSNKCNCVELVWIICQSLFWNVNSLNVGEKKVERKTKQSWKRVRRKLKAI